MKALITSADCGCGCRGLVPCGQGMSGLDLTEDFGIDFDTLTESATKIARAKDSCKETELQKVLIGVVLGALTAFTGYPFSLLQATVGLLLKCPAAREKMGVTFAQCLKGFPGGAVDRFLFICPQVSNDPKDLSPLDFSYGVCTPYNSYRVQTGTPEAVSRRETFGRYLTEGMTLDLPMKVALMWARYQTLYGTPTTAANEIKSIRDSIVEAKPGYEGAAQYYKTSFQEMYLQQFEKNLDAASVLEIVNRCLQGIAFSAAKQIDPTAAAKLTPPPQFAITPPGTAPKKAPTKGITSNVAFLGGAALLLLAVLKKD